MKQRKQVWCSVGCTGHRCPKAISLCHEKRQWRQCKVRIEKHDGLPAHELSGHTSLTDTESTRVADELADFKNESHRDELDILYTELVSAMSAASDQLKHKRTRCRAQPGWNGYVYDSHKAARDSFVIWRGIGKPRQGYEFDMMRLSRAQFKYALRSAKQQEGTHRRESLANKLVVDLPSLSLP